MKNNIVHLPEDGSNVRKHKDEASYIQEEEMT